MPTVQADAYGNAVGRFKSGQAGSMLKVLHLLRWISLHPYAPDMDRVRDIDGFASESARMTGLFGTLDKIHARGEKALVFLENLDMQDVIAAMAQQRYRLDHKPLHINGGVPGPRRQKAVDAFQNGGSGFDLMILSPRAGGVGLTLTAANHVIHLSRWWNPAVEDQCTDRIYRIGQQREVHVYYPMAKHPEIGEDSFDFLLDQLLTTKRDLSRRMLVPPVDTKADSAWFSNALGGRDAGTSREPTGATLEDIDLMEPVEFERWAIRVLRDEGYVAYRTPTSGDAGADGVFQHTASATNVILQCKHTGRAENVLGDQAANDLLRARTRFGLTDPVLVAITNAKGFTRSAQAAAMTHGIHLVSRERLLNWPEHCELA